jgi:small subunit ribosomal protein S16
VAGRDPDRRLDCQVADRSFELDALSCPGARLFVSPSWHPAAALRSVLRDRRNHYVAVHIRLTRVGATRRPAYRVIAIDSRRSRDGRALEILGFYDPLTDPITIKLDDVRIANWMARGALPSAAVQRLMKVALAGPAPKRKPTPAAEIAAAKPRPASRAKRTAAEAATEPAAQTTQAAPETAPDTEETAAEIVPPEASEAAPEAAPAPPAEADAETEQPAGDPAAETETEASAEPAETGDAAIGPAQPETGPADETEGES